MVRITYIGHSTVLVEQEGSAILFDPNFRRNVLFVRRTGALNYSPARLPALSAIAVSHTHLDHLDFEVFNFQKTDVPVIVPEGSGEMVGRLIPNPVIELAHWSEHEVGGINPVRKGEALNPALSSGRKNLLHSSLPQGAGLSNGVKIRAVPARHASIYIFPRHYKNAAGYVIEIGGKVIYFAGDTGYGGHFRDIGETCRIDVSLLPIGCYSPSFFMGRFHMTPEEAADAFADLRAGIMVPIHWGAFRLALEPAVAPIGRLKKVIYERNLEESVVILEPGGTYAF